MFGRRRREKAETGSDATVDSHGDADGDADGDRPQSHEEAAAFNERCGANLDEVQALEKSGMKTTAVLTDVVEAARLESLGQREFAVVAEVNSTDRPPFTTSFSIFDTTNGLYTPSIGQTIAVVYDAAEPPMVRAGIFWDKPALELMDDETGPVIAVTRWRVPSKCPNCGSPVDQSRESSAAHPECHTCDTPLPCEPL